MIRVLVVDDHGLVRAGLRALLANRQIAGPLGISAATVKAHLTNIYQRLGIVDRTQAALWAVTGSPAVTRGKPGVSGK